MIELQAIKVSKSEDWVNLKAKLKEMKLDIYIDDLIIQELMLRIKRDCQLIVEYPYMDSDYNSTYNNFYSKKHQSLKKECVRLHFFESDKLVKEEYLGFLTLRPTKIQKIGKTYLNPKLFLDDGFVVKSNFEVNLLGVKLNVEAYPWMQQETDIAVCAHVASWSVIRYYGNKYKNYSDKRMYDIVQMASESISRKIPSQGLSLGQISDILKSNGFTPLLVQKNKQREKDFIEELIAYIESGIPVIGAMTTKTHAISILGHGKLDIPLTVEKNIVMHSEFINSIIVSDDNYLPYKKVCKMGKNSTENYYLEDIDFMIVPLYDRMYLSYAAVKKNIKSLYESNNYNLKDKNILRIYLTSANSLKCKTNENSSMNNILKDRIKKMTLPKFVWCAEFSNLENYKKGMTEARVIIDSTCGTYETNPWLLIHDEKKIVYFNLEENCWEKIDENITAYEQYKSNLKEI